MNAFTFFILCFLLLQRFVYNSKKQKLKRFKKFDIKKQNMYLVNNESLSIQKIQNLTNLESLYLDKIISNIKHKKNHIYNANFTICPNKLLFKVKASFLNTNQKLYNIIKKYFLKIDFIGSNAESVESYDYNSLIEENVLNSKYKMIAYKGKIYGILDCNNFLRVEYDLHQNIIILVSNAEKQVKYNVTLKNYDYYNIYKKDNYYVIIGSIWKSKYILKSKYDVEFKVFNNVIQFNILGNFSISLKCISNEQYSKQLEFDNKMTDLFSSYSNLNAFSSDLNNLEFDFLKFIGIELTPEYIQISKNLKKYNFYFYYKKTKFEIICSNQSLNFETNNIKFSGSNRFFLKSIINNYLIIRY